MSDRETLLSLATRCEQATGPDRELDAEIMFDLYAHAVGQKEDGGPAGYLWPEDNPSWSFGIRFPGKDRDWFKGARSRIDGETLTIWRDGAWVLMNALRIPHLTASLDAALTLVPAGLKWSCGFSKHVPHNAQVWTSTGYYEGECDSNRAIALCIAALRARAAECAP